MSATPKRYRFDNPAPSFEPRPLPVRRPDAPPVESYDAYQPVQQQPQVVHIHQAPPDRTLQRVALGAGMGAGAIGAAVYLGPLLVASLTSIAITLAVGGLVLAVIVRGITAILAVPEQQPKGKRRR